MKTTIYSKIKKRTSMISIISMLCVGIASFAVIIYMRFSVIDTSEKLGNSSAGDSKQALITQTEEAIARLAESKAAISDEKLSETARYVMMISQNATKIMSEPDNYGKAAVDFPDASFAGKVTAQLRLPPNTDIAYVQSEINLIGNIQDLLVAVCSNSENVRSAYIGSESGVSISADIDSASKSNVYDPRERGWYISAKNENKLIWTDVFEDNSGRGLAITCAMPYYNNRGFIAGVVGIGSTLSTLSEAVVGTKIGETGYAFIINENGELIISDKIKTDSDGKIIRENLLENDAFPSEVVKKMISGSSGIEHVTVNGTDCLLAYEALDTLPWCLAIVISAEEVIIPAINSEMNIFALKNEALGKINKIILLIAAVLAVLVITAAFITFAASKRLAASFAVPIVELCNGAEIIGSGNLEHKLNIKTNDELEKLSDTFNFMIDNIKSITSEKERIGAELNIAAQIQSSMLPCIFPAFPDRREFEIYAVMQPAKEVGGDFYDFFLIDENTLAVVIADVSGKGVPAALFMVITKTLIKNNAQYGKSPKEVFETVNKLLCENNEADMFVTAFLGFLDIPTGKFIFVNAGHNPPVLRNSQSVSLLKSSACFILAGIGDIIYHQNEIILQSGDELFLYTDGLTEAVNKEDELYGEERLCKTINGCNNMSVRDFCKSVRYNIDQFTDGAEQADDITMLILRYKKNTGKLTIKAKIENTEIVLNFIEEYLNACSLKICNQIKIAVEEIFSNIARYAYEPDDGDATIRISADKTIAIEFEDEGIAYDPLTKEDPNIKLPLEEREEGGFGIFMVKNMMDFISYRREENKNILLVKKNVQSENALNNGNLQ